MTQKRTAKNQRVEQTLVLRNPAVAAILAWLLPGAGHLYQRRYFKAAGVIVLRSPEATGRNRFFSREPSTVRGVPAIVV